jgi:hypothetical protein
MESGALDRLVFSHLLPPTATDVVSCCILADPTPAHSSTRPPAPACGVCYQLIASRHLNHPQRQPSQKDDNTKRNASVECGTSFVEPSSDLCGEIKRASYHNRTTVIAPHTTRPSSDVCITSCTQPPVLIPNTPVWYRKTRAFASVKDTLSSSAHAFETRIYSP